jgi:hypothetical protein
MELQMPRPNTEDDDSFDERGTLRPGKRARVPMMLRDSAAYFNRSGVKITDGSGSTVGLHKPGHRSRRRPVNDALDTAYEDYEKSITEAWRTPVADRAVRTPPEEYGNYPYSAGAEGAACTINGAPGRLVRRGDVLVCRPIKQAGPLDHQLLMDRLYSETDLALSAAWRHGGTR